MYLSWIVLKRTLKRYKKPQSCDSTLNDLRLQEPIPLKHQHNFECTGPKCNFVNGFAKTWPAIDKLVQSYIKVVFEDCTPHSLLDPTHASRLLVKMYENVLHWPILSYCYENKIEKYVLSFKQDLL